MTKHWQTFEHTADVGLSAKADTLSELFEALGDGVAGIICRRDKVEAEDTRELRLTAEDREALAVDFLSEVVSIMQVDRFMVHYVRVDEVTDKSICAEIIGEPYEPTRHELHTEIKAVTYHLLKIEPDKDKWVGQVILDI